MTSARIEDTKRYWPHLAATLHTPNNGAEYGDLVRLLDNLSDEVGEDESRPLASLMALIEVLIEHFEDQHVPEFRAQSP